MTGPQYRDRITYVQPSGRLWHGTVTSRKGDTFVFRPAWSDIERISAKDGQENCTWMRGTLRWWWPPHRRLRKALRVAYALGDEKVKHVVDANFDEALAAAQRALDRGMRRLTADAQKLSADAARLTAYGLNRFRR